MTQTMPSGARVEHMQIVVSDLEEAARSYCEIFQWMVRGSGREIAADREYDWVHVGDDASYLAFRSPYNDKPFEDAHRGHSGNHIGIVVRDLDGIVERLGSMGVAVRHAHPHPFRRRAYFRDFDGNEVELVQYLSDDPAEQNDYSS